MHIDLARNINLCTIRLDYTDNRILSLLSQVVLPCLSHLFFDVVLNSGTNIPELEKVDWARMQRIFTQEQWANVTITWKVFGLYESTPMANEFIKARLPVLQSRGMLKFCE